MSTDTAPAAAARPTRSRVASRLVPVSMLVAFLFACTSGVENSGPNGVVEVEGEGEKAPSVGECRMLTADDVAQPANSTNPIDCDQPHTAQTILVSTFSSKFDTAAYGDPVVSRAAYVSCSKAFRRYLGADESLSLRTVLSWAWFRPTETEWAAGDRRFRCDLVGGGEQSQDYVTLPRSAKKLLAGRPDDKWMVCASGPTVAGSVKVPCSEPHSWRAVTTIKLGEPDDAYPGDRVAEVRTKEFCSDSVSAWLNYPVQFDFGFTWFRKAEWQAGNRRSICWAKTEQ